VEKIQREYIFAVLAKIHEDGGKVIALGKGWEGENFRLTLSRLRQQSASRRDLSADFGWKAASDICISWPRIRTILECGVICANGTISRCRVLFECSP